MLSRYCGIDGHGKAVEDALWKIAESLLPDNDVAVYTQALMDMGAMLCTRSNPQCESCPVQGDCSALQTGRVSELPTPRPKKIVPERSVTFLLAMSDGKILLEKRKSSGIWGGLWCLPETDEEEFEAYCKGWNIDEQVTWPGFTHAFTHFRLNIYPLFLKLAEKPDHKREHAWMRPDEALQAAIPAPVRKLLSRLANP